MSTCLRTMCLLVLSGLLLTGARVVAQQEPMNPDQLRAFEHTNPQWPNIQTHLPDPATASPQQLETAADVLRARRFPQDALDYYMYAARRGGNEVPILNKMGITELDLGHFDRARAYFERVIKLKKKSAEGWNNLGAVEYISGRNGSAIYDYKRAIKLNKKGATYHSNLATAYLQEKDWHNARKEFTKAVSLDPAIFQHSDPTGVVARMLTTEDHARFCFEMARIFEGSGDIPTMLHYLGMASEEGFDILEAMDRDPAMKHFSKDPRVLLIVRNSRALRTAGRASVENVDGHLPPLPPSEQTQHE